MIGENNKVNDAETFRGFRSEEKYLMMQRASVSRCVYQGKQAAFSPELCRMS
jgi:hypothetical protein